MGPNKVAKLVKIAVSALEDIKAREIVVLDVRKLTSLYDTLVIASADSARQTKALAAHLREDIKAAGGHIIGSEGEASGEWVLVDCGDFVVHIMQPAARAHYNLEELWTPPEPVRPAKVADPVKVSASAVPKKTAASKAAPKTKSAVKKTATKTAAPKVSAAKPAAAKKAAVKKVAAKKVTAKAVVAKAAPAVVKKSAASKAAPPKAAVPIVRRRLKST